ncbi:uncharacterized protein LOC125592621 [Brassica napus]|uniref:uncharacterized protein LOC125592621 n=1 Tax=Brassica napus TaxID=3708 RepID=UPI00207A29A8|nr:uncharacterized protein LOC125592621 [Brassica napus]
MFNGLAAEIPLDHIANFERVCNFSRAMECHQTTSNAPCSHSLLMGKQLAAQRHKISNFKQKTDEPFYDAWERYKKYRRECPHHGFEDDYILEVFYDGVSYEFRNALDSSSYGDFMTQTTQGAFALIENMTSSSLNKNKENDHSKTENIIDDLAAKVDQLIKGNQSQVFIMEETASENSASDVTPDAENTVDDQQEVSYVTGQGWQYKNYRPNPNVRNNAHLFVYPKQDKLVDNAHNIQGQNTGYQKPYQGRTYVLSQAQHNQFQNQKQQTAQQAAPSSMTAPQDEMKGLATMMQQFLQGQQIQGKALNQVTIDINSRMNHMFNDLSTKYDNVTNHMRQMDVQIAQTAESVKRQQVALRSGKRLPDAIPKKLSAEEKGKQKEGEKPQSKAVPLSDGETEQHAETDPTPFTTPVESVPPREYIPKVPYPFPAKISRKDREETKCKKMLEDLTIKLPLIDAIQMIPSMQSLMKGLVSGKITGDSELLLVSKECNAVLQNRPIKKLGDPGKFVLLIQIGKTVFACSLCELGSSVNLMPYSVAKPLGFTDF